MTQSFPCASTSPSLARRFCTDGLSGLFSDDCPATTATDSLIADAEMIVSELVTNAVNAASSSVQLTLRASCGSVHIEVADDAAGVPQRGEPGVEATSGRGLMIVSALADDWGVQANGHGKCVWALVRLPDEPAG